MGANGMDVQLRPLLLNVGFPMRQNVSPELV